MATGPGDDLEAAGRGHLRASHANREQVIGVLKAAFVQGMLDRDEFDLRAGQALTSRTYADLAALTADLPAGAAAAQPPQPACGLGKTRVLRPGRVLAVYAAAWPVAFILPGDSENGFTLLLLASLAYLFVLLISVGEMVVSRIDQRSGGQLPQGPASGVGRQASQACHQPARAGNFRRSIPVDGIPPKQRRSSVPACCPASTGAGDGRTARSDATSRRPR